MTNGNDQDISCLFYYDYGDISGIRRGQRLDIVPVVLLVTLASLLLLLRNMIIVYGLFHPDELKGTKLCAEET